MKPVAAAAPVQEPLVSWAPSLASPSAAAWAPSLVQRSERQWALRAPAFHRHRRHRKRQLPPKRSSSMPASPVLSKLCVATCLSYIPQSMHLGLDSRLTASTAYYINPKCVSTWRFGTMNSYMARRHTFLLSPKRLVYVDFRNRSLAFSSEARLFLSPTPLLFTKQSPSEWRAIVRLVAAGSLTDYLYTGTVYS